MDWSTILTNQGGWAACALLAVEICRRVWKGDLVLGREYRTLLEDMEKETTRAESLVQEQKNDAKTERQQLLDRIESQKRLLDRRYGTGVKDGS